MKPGDEIVVDGKTYVAAEAKNIELLFGFRINETGWGRMCNYCTDACKIERGGCIRFLYRKQTKDQSLSPCSTDDPRVYFFLKPEVDHETG